MIRYILHTKKEKLIASTVGEWKKGNITVLNNSHYQLSLVYSHVDGSNRWFLNEMAVGNHVKRGQLIHMRSY